MTDKLPSIDDLLESKLPSADEFIKENNLPSVDEFLEPPRPEEEIADNLKAEEEAVKEEVGRSSGRRCRRISGGW